MRSMRGINAHYRESEGKMLDGAVNNAGCIHHARRQRGSHLGVWGAWLRDDAEADRREDATATHTATSSRNRGAM